MLTYRTYKMSWTNIVENKTFDISISIWPVTDEAGTQIPCLIQSSTKIFITVTSQWARWRLKSPASRLFTQPFIHAQIIEKIKAPRHWPLWGEFTGEFTTQRASNA